MANQYTIDELFTNDKLVVRVDSKEEWDRVNEVAGKRGMIPIQMVCFEDAQRIDGNGGVCLHCSKEDNHVWWSSTDYYLGEDYTIVPYYRIDFSTLEKKPKSKKCHLAGKKYRCVGYKCDCRFFTLGKVYTLKDNGDIINDNGYRYRHCVYAYCGGVIPFLSDYYDFVEVTDENPSRYQIIIECVDDVTTAKMIVDGKEVRVGTSKRNPTDQFDFAVGARYAFNRLWEKMPKEVENVDGFKIGDRVKYVGDLAEKNGRIGTVRDFWDDDIGVEFDDNVRGHTMGLGKYGYMCRPSHGWWCRSEDLEKLN